jgi:ParB-like chromosome segregation protein Spo0J
MAAKGIGKKGALGDSIARAGVTTGLGNALAAINAGVGTTVLEELDIALLDVDPTNARDLSFVNFKNPIATNTEGLTPEQMHVWSRLQDLANNLRAVKRLVNPVEVYPNDMGRYTLVHGHRRYVASRLAGLRLIRSQITAPDSPQKKLVQWAENFHSEQLTLPERIVAFKSAYVELHDNASVYTSLLQKEGKLHESDIASMLGMAERTLRYYKNVMNADGLVGDAIQDGVVTRVKDASALARINNETLVKDAITALRSNDRALFDALVDSLKLGEEETKPAAKEAQEATPKRSGRKRQAIATKQIKNPNVIKHIFAKFGRDIGVVDWSDLDAVTEAWQSLIDSIDAELSGQS